MDPSPHAPSPPPLPPLPPPIHVTRSRPFRTPAPALSQLLQRITLPAIDLSSFYTHAKTSPTPHIDSPLTRRPPLTPPPPSFPPVLPSFLTKKQVYPH